MCTLEGTWPSWLRATIEIEELLFSLQLGNKHASPEVHGFLGILALAYKRSNIPPRQTIGFNL